MKISYNWLKQYISPLPEAKEVAGMLTNCGMEVEGMETVETVKGGMRGLIVGQVMTKTQHPNADRLSLTAVDIGTDTLLNIVCGAPNVAANQKVLVATVGAKLFPTEGEPFEIKKSKIRGAVSEGIGRTQRRRRAGDAETGRRAETAGAHSAPDGAGGGKALPRPRPPQRRARGGAGHSTSAGNAQAPLCRQGAGRFGATSDPDPPRAAAPAHEPGGYRGGAGAAI